jgi:phosphoesterase RecJ-like protein
MTPDDLLHAADVLRDAPKVAIACHVNPDADALGAMLALADVLAVRHAEVVCSFPNDPFDLPGWSSLLPGLHRLVEPHDFPREPALMVTCDCASLDRLGMLAPVALSAGELVWIDHHRSNDGYGTVRLVDPDASSTCELVVRLVDAIGIDLTEGAAAALYAGLVTDTGRFQYQATTPETLRLAARLREYPFDHVALSQALYEANHVSYLRLLGVALGRVHEVPGGDLVWTYVTQADLIAAGVGSGETDDLIDVIRTDRDVDVAALVKQQSDGRFKVSVRSRGGHDLSAVAAAFGGGGHRLAAGYTSQDGPSETVERLVEALRAERVAP